MNTDLFVINEQPKFDLGILVVTTGIDRKMLESSVFFIFVQNSLRRYARCDWGDTCKEDKKQNDESLKNGERIFAVYKLRETTIWIITEWDRSVTTILFPDEY